MKILHEGKAHKAIAWLTTCRVCESDLRIIEGDPHATPNVCYNCDASQYYIRYICPVCKSKNVAKTRSSFGDPANAERKEFILDEEDREEIKNWENEESLSDDEIKFINNRCRV